MSGVNADCVLDVIDRGRGATDGRLWTLDPVDGTQRFVRGDQYMVALALIVGGQIEIPSTGPGGDRLRRQKSRSVSCRLRSRIRTASRLILK
jgi:hypothetical protein